jgi:hypothetical protein
MATNMAQRTTAKMRKRLSFDIFLQFLSSGCNYAVWTSIALRNLWLLANTRTRNEAGPDECSLYTLFAVVNASVRHITFKCVVGDRWQASDMYAASAWVYEHPLPCRSMHNFLVYPYYFNFLFNMIGITRKIEFIAMHLHGRNNCAYVNSYLL